MAPSSAIARLHAELLARHGPQGWWPLFQRSSRSVRYHPTDYSVPRGQSRVEVIVGAVLAQNTSWQNVVRALAQIHEARAMSWRALVEMRVSRLERLVRPAGYFRQKARKLKEVARFFHSRRGAPRRAQLLALWGVGPETADSILLYAYGVPVMIVDAYLRRVLARRGFEQEAAWSYEDLRTWIEDQLPPDHGALNEFHALLVAEGKALRASN